MNQDDDRVPVMPNTWMPARSQEMKDAYRSWMSARIQALKREHPKHRKRDCWRVAQREWNELRHEQSRTSKGAPTRAGYRRVF
jgi:hypothetical protein